MTLKSRSHLTHGSNTLMPLTAESSLFQVCRKEPYIISEIIGDLVYKTIAKELYLSQVTFETTKGIALSFLVVHCPVF